MPRIVKTKRTLLDIFENFNPVLLSNGQIRMECPLRENHMDGSGRKSFFVSPDINAYHCFSCGAHGNLAKLLVRQFGVSYFDAVELVSLTTYERPKEAFDLDVMWNFNEPPHEFLRRGYTRDCLKYFRVGLSDDGSMVIPYYDNFKTKQNLLGYQKRWYEPTRRVLNSKGFDRKNYLYNFDKDNPYVVLVEGQSDVWRLHQYGFHACALMGSDISPEQVSMLAGMDTVYLALDNDMAGRRASEICNYFLRNHTKVLLVPYTAKDPGECSFSEWDRTFKESTDYAQYTVELAMNWEGYLDMKEDAVRDCEGRNGY